MFIKYLKLILIITFFYQIPLYSKSKDLKDFNSKYLSNYFSGIIAYENKNNLEALEFFKSSRSLLNKHDPYLEKYTYSLVLESKVKQAINEIKQNSDKSNSRFFEARLMLAIDSLKRKDFKKVNFILINLMSLLTMIKLHCLFISLLKNIYILFKKVKF